MVNLKRQLGNTFVVGILLLVITGILKSHRDGVNTIQYQREVDDKLVSLDSSKPPQDTENDENNKSSPDLTAHSDTVKNEQTPSKKTILKADISATNICKVSVDALREYLESAQGRYEAKGGRVCEKFRYEGHMTRTVLMNVLKNRVNYSAWDVTFTTQLSVDRLDRVKKILSLWNGSLSVAVYTSIDDLISTFLPTICQQNSLYTRDNIHYHIVIEKGEFYPVNYLRRVALDGAQTEYVFLTDVDMMPIPLMDELLLSWIRKNNGSPKKAWVVPAFETVSYKFTMPKSKHELTGMVRHKQLRQFLGRSYKYAYLATDYNRWMTSKYSYVVDYQPDFEPYVVIRKDEVPSYDTTFLGRVRDKVSHAIAIHLAGIEFIVLPHVFVIHQAHADREEIVSSAKSYKLCSNAAYVQYMKKMARLHPDKPFLLGKFLPSHAQQIVRKDERVTSSKSRRNR